MSRIESLMAKLCPGGVEFRELQDVFTTRGGYTPSKTDGSAWADGTIPWFRMEDLRENGGVLSDSLQHIHEGAVKGGRLFPADSILIATSATIGEHALITIPHLSNQRFTSLAVRSNFADRLEMKFAYYYCFILDEWCRNNTTTSSFASVDMAGFKRFKFPIPPIEVQREIIRILDLFTSLEAGLRTDLRTELERRRQQYTHYRDALLATLKSEGVPWVPLGEVAINLDSRRRPVTKSAREPGEIPYYGASGIVDYVSDYIFDGDYLLVSEDGANLLARSTPIAFTASGKTWINNHAHVLEINTYIERRFIEFYLNSIDLLPYITGGAQPKLNKANMNRIPVPQPDFVEQERIVKVLNAFDSLVKDLSSSLSAEITARRQQYEYYRDRLLAFEEVVA